MAEDINFIPDDVVPPVEESHPIMNTLRGAGKAIGYLENAIGGPIEAAARGLASGRDVYDFKEHMRAINPLSLDTYPTHTELLERANPGSTKDMSPLAKIGSDIAWSIGRDPLTYLSLGGSAEPKAGLRAAAEYAKYILNKPAELVGAAGKKMSRRGLLPFIQAGERNSKAVAKTFYKHGLKGDPITVYEKMPKVMTKLGEDLNEIYDAADMAGASINKYKAFTPFEKKLSEMVSKSKISPEAKEKAIEETLGLKLKHEDPSTSLAKEWKTNIGEDIPQKYRGPFNLNASGVQLEKSLERGLKEEIERTVTETLGKTKGEELKQINMEYGDLRTILPKAQQIAQNFERKPFITTTDLALGAGAYATPTYGIPIAIAKKMYDLSRSPNFLSRAGSAAQTLSRNPVTAPMINILPRKTFQFSLQNSAQVPQEDPNFIPD